MLAGVGGDQGNDVTASDDLLAHDDRKLADAVASLPGMGPCMGMLLLPFTSLAVMTLMTPGMASASLVSIDRMLA